MAEQIKEFTKLVKHKQDKQAINLIYKNITKVEEYVLKYHKNIKSIPDKDTISLIDNNNKINVTSMFRTSVTALINRHRKMVLSERVEVKRPQSNINYIVTVADNIFKLRLFILYILVYFMEATTRVHRLKESDCCLNNKPHAGIDYEFKKGKIALMQINFETYADKTISTNSYIWLLNPDELDDTSTKILINCFMTDKNVYKILQGAESLDIPYMYDTLFSGYKKDIVKFTRKLIDTKYLCEYYKLYIEKDKKCSIYDALKYFGTISAEKYDDLIRIHEGMGPVQDVPWDVHNMDSYHVKYALYDVLFLKRYLIDTYLRISKGTPHLVPSYKYINPIVRFVYLERRSVTNIIEETKYEVNPMNNYMIKYKSSGITLMNVYNTVMKNFKIFINNSTYIDIDFILTVGFLKNVISILFKKAVYYLLSKSYPIYKNKDNKMTKNISMKLTYSKLKLEGYQDVLDLLTMFTREAQKKISMLYK